MGNIRTCNYINNIIHSVFFNINKLLINFSEYEKIYKELIFVYNEQVSLYVVDT